MGDFENDWILICNDDCVPTRPLEQEIWGLLNSTSHKMFLLCHPNGFSGFLLNKKFWEDMGMFRDEFPEGYYEDDDWFLRVALNTNSTREEVMKYYIFSFYDNYGFSLFKHKPNPEVSSKKWNKHANKLVFDKYWREVPPKTMGSIENKGGKWYVPVE
jgi:hypothetical protein